MPETKITIQPTDDTKARRQAFFKLIFGNNEGIIGLAERGGPKGWVESFFDYPSQMDAMLEWIDLHVDDRDLYFCSQLLRERKRVAPNVSLVPNLYADLDAVDPADIKDFPPTVTVQTSPGHWHGYWVLNEALPPQVAEVLNRKLTYHLKADKSGWDLTQVLRVPVSYNLKRDVPFIVDIDGWHPTVRYNGKDFDGLPDVPGAKPILSSETPALDRDADEVLGSYKGQLFPAIYELYNTESEDRSAALWRLEKLLLESGMPIADAFLIAWNSKCNKYKLDNRSPNELWYELSKAEAQLEAAKEQEERPEIILPDLLTASERESLPATFVDRYVEWNRTRTDAAWQYHQLSAMILLSAILADSVHLPTEYGKIVPNIWGMILGDTTLTRKSTAMDIAIELLSLVYEEAYLASDASVEGLLSAVATRPNMTSVFVRDEFGGMLDAIKRRDYQAGMMEALTKLYDGKYQKRQLRKETIEVRDPVFIMFCGGIRGRIMELLDEGDIESGFIPRFLFVSAEPNMDTFKPLGPPTKETRQVNTEFVEELFKMRNEYDIQTQVTIGTQIITAKGSHVANLTPDAWARYAAFERAMVMAGRNSERPDDYTPTFDRLAKSGLKCAVLLAASRQTPTEEGVIVGVEDVLQGIKYIDQWKEYTIEVLKNAGKTVAERTIERAYGLMRRGKLTRASLMNSMHLGSREADTLLDTMEQRGLIVRSRQSNKTERITLA